MHQDRSAADPSGSKGNLTGSPGPDRVKEIEGMPEV
jgi:hypothetical protein